MRILVLSNLYPPDVLGGYELGCRQAVDALRRRGHDVRVLTSAPRRPVNIEPHVHRRLKLTEIWSHYQFLKSAAVTAHVAQGESHRINAFNIHVLLSELQDFQPDVVYVWMIVGLGGLGLIACLLHQRVPWVWHLMDDVPVMLCKSAGELVPTYAREFGRQVRGSFISCSQQLVDEIERAGVPLGEDVEVIPNWIDGSRLPPRRSYRQGGQLRIVSAAGQIDARVDKGIDRLVKAAAILRDRGVRDVSIDVYGHASDSSIPDLVAKLGVEKTVRLMGSRTQEDLYELYGEYDLFAFPTRPREPFGFAALEAAARGCVPILSHTCGIAEWLVHGVYCLKAPRTAEAFADVLHSVHRGSIDLEALGHRAASVVGRDFHLDSIAPRIELLLQREAGRARTGAGTPEEAYRMALLAERLDRVLVQERFCA